MPRYDQDDEDEDDVEGSGEYGDTYYNKQEKYDSKRKNQNEEINVVSICSVPPGHRPHSSCCRTQTRR